MKQRALCLACYKRARRREAPEQYREADRKWTRANRDKTREYARRYRAKPEKAEAIRVCVRERTKDPVVRERKNETMRRTYERHRERYQQEARDRRAQEDKAEARARREASGHYEKMRRSHLRREYGLTLEEYERMLAEQGNKCAICLQPLGLPRSRSATAPVVDHCHASGKVRGILHRTCNTVLGLLKDCPAHLDAAAAYLRKHGC